MPTFRFTCPFCGHIIRKEIIEDIPLTSTRCSICYTRIPMDFDEKPRSYTYLPRTEDEREQREETVD